MEYPKEFIERVKEEYPDWGELHESLEQGTIFVGQYLKDKVGFEMSATQIVIAFNEGRQREVKEAAERCVRREKLRDEWAKIYFHRY